MSSVALSWQNARQSSGIVALGDISLELSRSISSDVWVVSSSQAGEICWRGCTGGDRDGTWPLVVRALLCEDTSYLAGFRKWQGSLLGVHECGVFFDIN